jgi:Kelch motif
MMQLFPKKIRVLGEKFVHLLLICAALMIASLVYAQDDTHSFAFNGMNSMSGKSGIDGKNLKSDLMFYNDENQGDNKGPRVFDAELGHKLSDGIKVTATRSQYAVKMIPITMSQSTGTREGNRITYALYPGVHIIYTFKGNGVKEDIIFDNPATAPAQLAFQLDLDPVLEARLDKKGNILIHGPNFVLSGFIQASDEKSAELILKARRNAPKDHLLYVIPAPVVIDGEGKNYQNSAYYTLEKSVLTLYTGSIAELPALVSIDPSIVVTTTADFKAGNNEGMISFDTDAISRAVASGGPIGTWFSTTTFPTARSAHATVAYNGYLYITGGWDGTNALDDVLYAPINADGTIGAWNTTTSMDGYPKYAHASVAYNGYLYVIDGT